MKCPQRRPIFRSKFLPISDVGPVAVGVANVRFVYLDVLAVGQREKIRDAADVVGMPVREDSFRDAGFLRSEDGFQGLDPGGTAFTGVDEETARSLANEVCVCAFCMVGTSVHPTSTSPA